MPSSHRSHSRTSRDSDRSRSYDRGSSRSRTHDRHRDRHSRHHSSDRHSRYPSSERSSRRHSSRDRRDDSRSRASESSRKRYDDRDREGKRRYNEEHSSSKRSEAREESRTKSSKTDLETPAPSSSKNTLSQILSMATKSPLADLDENSALKELLDMEKALNIETSLPLPATPISPMPKSPLTGGGIQLSAVNGTLLQPESTLYMKRTTSSTNPYLQDTNATQQTPMVDPRIKMSSVRRQPKRLVFLNPGEITKKAEQDRHIFMQQQISQATKIEKGNIPSHLPASTAPSMTTEEQEIKPAASQDTLPPRPHVKTPSIEWWDRIFLPKKIQNRFKSREDNLEDVDYSMCSLDNCEFKELIYHPIPVDRTKNEPTILKQYLTKDEQKRLRRKRRKEEEDQKRILIQAGQQAPPPQKLTMHNYMEVLGAEATNNPTATLLKVKQQMEERERAFKEDNERRKLTPEERKIKNKKKIIGERGDVTEVRVYRVSKMSSKNLFKVNINAQQLYLKGVLLSVPSSQCHCVYVEGTKKSINRYDKLMTHRIKWNEIEGTEDDTQNTADASNEKICVMMWQGVMPSTHFGEFSVQQYETPAEARRVMEQKGLAQYWDLCINYQPEVESLF